ncbi:MAG: MscS Mechanosensitive ion channel [Polaromonas sp.]|nr:MscS Mechanosensitive ion channel [Polaromonas sp.]
MGVFLTRCGLLPDHQFNFPAAFFRCLRALAAALLGLLLLLAAASAWAQPEDIDLTLDTARAQIDKANKTLEAPAKDGVDLPALRAQVLGAGAAAEAAIVALEPQLASLQARLDELGPLTPGQPEAPDVAALRATLNKGRAVLDAQLKRARLLAVESDQKAGQISSLRRAEFQARLGERGASIVSKLFWSDLRLELPSDLRRASRMLNGVLASAQASGGTIWTGIGLALAVLLGLAWWAHRALLKLTTTRVPPGRLRRSLHAWTLVVLPAATAGLMAQAIYLGLGWTTPLPDAVVPLFSGLAGVICFGGFVLGLGHALLLPGRPSWRLLPLPDALALRLRWMPSVLAVLIVLTWVASRLTAQVNASLATTVAAGCIVALAMALVMMLALLQSHRARKQALREPGAAGWPASPLWLTAVVGLAWFASAVSVLALLLGYVAFGSFLVQQMVWILVVLGTAYLLIVVIDDGFTTLLCPKTAVLETDAGAAGTAAQPAPALFKVREQAAVLLSGVGRLVVVLLTLLLLLAPFGEGPTELFQRADQLHQGISIGEFQIRPVSVLQALLVMVLAMLGVRMVRRWLTNHFLPTTSMDRGMQLSAATLFGYIGNVMAISMGLAAVGIGLERLAWVASALSVGIGFGLQAVVQNFVSGLILLAERPVKVGDWVSLGGIEGDIRRINVRATEIQMGDRSTVIVPNSEFITKTVRNVTHANPMGLVQLKLPVPLVSDAEQVKNLIREAFEAHAEVLSEPAPNVQLDGIDSAGLVFNATGFVSSPRMAYGVRSDLLFDVLKRLRDAGISLGKPPTMLVREEPAGPPEPVAPVAPLAA